jgi:integrase
MKQAPRKGGLTVKAIEALKPRERPYEFPDGDGLYLTVRPNNSRSFNLRYRHGGKPRNYTIGPAAIGLAEARKLAKEALVKIARGEDPSSEKAARKAAERAPKPDLFENVVADFVRVYCIGPDEKRPHIRDWRESERLLKKHFAPEWTGRRLSEIGRGDVTTALDKIVTSGAKIGANRAFAVLRKMCAWAVSRGLAESSPCDGLTRPSSEKGRARERVLDERELALVWRASDSLGHPFGPMVKIFMLTGQRRTEVGAMEWAEIDPEKAEWTLPVARSKNHRAHTVPLAPAALAVLQQAPRIVTSKGANQPRFVFTTSGDAASSGYSLAKQRLDAAIAELNDGKPLVPWVFHDIRRSVATHMAALGVSIHVIERCLNHVSGSFAGLVSVYQKHGYEKEKRAAFEAWARRLDEMITGKPAAENVVEIASKRV